MDAQLRGHVAYADDPHTPIGVVVAHHPAPNAVTVAFYGSGMETDVIAVEELVAVGVSAA